MEAEGESMNSNGQVCSCDCYVIMGCFDNCTHKCIDCDYAKQREQKKMVAKGQRQIANSSMVKRIKRECKRKGKKR